MDVMEFGLRKTFHLSQGDIQCVDDKCKRPLSYGSLIYIDALNASDTYCEACGKCVRFKRRKQAERTPERELQIRRAGLQED